MSALRILILQLKRIGDAILTAPALASLRAALPEARLHLVLSGAAAQLAPAFGMVDTVSLHRPVPGRGNALTRILGRRFDVSLDFSGTDRTALLALASRASLRCGFEKDAKNWLRRRALNHRCSASVRDLHTIDRHHFLVESALTALGCPVPPRVPDAGHLHLPPQAAERILTKPAVVLHPGTAREEKYWSAAGWQKVIRHMRDVHGLPVILTGSNDPAETAHLREIEQGAVIQENLAGRLSLPELAALLSRAALVLGVDSAAMHLAAAFARPQVALFGPTNPFHWRPRHGNARVLLAGCPENDSVQHFSPHMIQAPMTSLVSARVTSAIDSLLLRVE